MNKIKHQKLKNNESIELIEDDSSIIEIDDSNEYDRMNNNDNSYNDNDNNNNNDKTEFRRRRSSSIFHSRPLSNIQFGDHCGYKQATYIFGLLCCVLFIVIMILSRQYHKLNNDNSNNDNSNHIFCSGMSCSKSGMISSTNYLATEAGLEILRAGGNAVDAAVATQLALNVVQPQSTGIGGGCFILYYNASTKEVIALDGREEAPYAFHANRFCKDVDCANNENCTCTSVWETKERETGGNPVGVPGTLAAVHRLLEDYGTLTLHELIKPAKTLAIKGFPMSKHLHSKIMENKQRLERFPASKKLFLSNNGEPVPVGDIFKNPDLADTFDEIANDYTSFYSGEIAQDIISTLQNATNPITNLGSLMTLDDLARYRAVYRHPVEYMYRNRYKVYGFPYPSSGGSTMSMILNMLEYFDPPRYYPSTTYFKGLIDSQNIAFADRNKYMADADFIDVPAELLSKSYAKQRVNSKMSFTSMASIPVEPGNIATSEQYGVSYDTDRHGTTHLCTVDKDGNIISMTTTIEENLGSAVVVKDRGFLLNNELTDFAPKKFDSNGNLYANRAEGGTKPRRTALGTDATTLGGKRPMSSMSPTIVFDNKNEKFRLAIGSPGGSRIIAEVTNVLLNILDLNMTIYDATNLPRIFSRNDVSEIEERLMLEHQDILDELEQLGLHYKLFQTDRPHGFVESILVQDNGYIAGMADFQRIETALAKGL